MNTMNRIVEIAKRSNQYMNQFTANVVRVIEDNSDKMLDFNRSQMINSKDADDSNLVHKSTGSTKLSKAYSRKTGKSKPDLLLSGSFQDKMTFIMQDENEYFISSKDFKTEYLAENYGNIFGISPKNQVKAQKINDKAIIEDYLETILG